MGAADRESQPHTFDAPLRLHRARVLPEWIDYNGHMNEAYHVLIYSHATDVLFDIIGLDAQTRERTQRSIFTAEAHIAYLSEVRVGEEIEVLCHFLDHDDKRLHFFNRLRRASDGVEVALAELLMLHIDTASRRVVPFAPEVMERLRTLKSAHARLSVPPQIGRAIRAPSARRRQ
jgi:acyl-CoA thioester hydrolase